MAAGGSGEVLFGFHSVYEALRAGKRQVETVLVTGRRAGKRAEKIASLAESLQVPVAAAAPEELDRLSKKSPHQGMAARVSALPVPREKELLERIQKRQTPWFALVLAHIEDPHNLGALIRTALCAGVDFILIPKDRSCPPTPAVSRASAGAMEHADIFMVTNIAACLKTLKKHDAWVFGLEAAGTTGLFDADLTGNLVLVIGSEHKGIGPAIQKACDFLLSIPISGKVNSLNASVAGGIAMYEARRQRMAGGVS